jgi:hypothetical protein
MLKKLDTALQQWPEQWLAPWRQPSPRRIWLFLGLWLLFIGYVVLESWQPFGPDLGFLPTLAASGFARVMFSDIGILSTLAAVWMLLERKHWSAPIFAFAMLFLGSGSLLLYLALRDWLLWRETKIAKA